MAHRLRNDVAAICQLTEGLQLTSLDPTIDGASSLNAARDLLVLLRKELSTWHLSDSRLTLTGLTVRTLGSIDRDAVLARHGIRMPDPLSDNFEEVRSRLLAELVAQAPRLDGEEPHTGEPGDQTLDEQIALMIAEIDRLLAEDDHTSAGWQRRARKLTRAVAALLSKIVLSVTAAALSGLVTNSLTGTDLVHNVIGCFITSFLTLATVSAQHQLSAPSIPTALDGIDKDLRGTALEISGILHRVSEGAVPRGHPDRSRLASLAEHCERYLYCAERLIELSDCSKWQESEAYLIACREVTGFAKDAVRFADKTSWRARRIMRRTIVPDVDAALTRLRAFVIPDKLPIDTRRLATRRRPAPDRPDQPEQSEQPDQPDQHRPDVSL